MAVRRAAEISSQRILVRQKPFTHAFNVFSTVIFPIAETESSGVLSDRDDLARRKKVVRGGVLNAHINRANKINGCFDRLYRKLLIFGLKYSIINK